MALLQNSQRQLLPSAALTANGCSDVLPKQNRRSERKAEFERRHAEYEEERRCKQQLEREQAETEAERSRLAEILKVRRSTFESIIEEAPASFARSDARLPLFLIHLDYRFLINSRFTLPVVAATQQSDSEIVLAASDGIADEKLTGLALRLVLSEHIGITHESQADLLTESERVFAPNKPKAGSNMSQKVVSRGMS